MSEYYDLAESNPKFWGLKQRDLNGKRSMLEFATGEPVTFWDIHLQNLTVENLDQFLELIRHPSTIYAWVKKDHVTIVRCEGCVESWLELMEGLCIECIPGEKLSKRIARAASPRDGVIDDVADIETHIHWLEENELMDGVFVVRRSWLINALRETGHSTAVLRKLKRLSMTIITGSGTIKGVAYVSDDCVADIVCSTINLKAEMRTTDDSVYINFDFQYKYKNPKSNGEADVFLGRMLFTADEVRSVLEDVLGSAQDAIFAGESCRVTEDWGLVDLDTKTVSIKTNPDFKALPNMADDLAQREVDERESPTLVSMIASSYAKQYRQLSKKGVEWARYPIPCVWGRPIISETAAELIGDPIEVPYGTLRPIRGGDVWVCNDWHWEEEVRLNCGGGDFDDDFSLYFRTIEGEKSILVARNPMGWKEFTVFRYIEDMEVEDDSLLNPVYTLRNGSELRFPIMPGKVPTNLTQDTEAGRITFRGLPDYPNPNAKAPYGPDAVCALVSELVKDDSGNVGTVINAITLAAAVAPWLLADQITTKEDIIDTFTQGGAARKRKALVRWALNLLEKIANLGVPIDPKIWERRAGNTPSENVVFEEKFWTGYEAFNVEARAEFMTNCNAFAQESARQGGVLVAKMEIMFGATRDEALSVASGVLPVAGALVEEWRLLMKLRNQIAQSEFLSGLRTQISLTSEDWGFLYTDMLEAICDAAGPDPIRQQYLTVAVWFMAMSMPTKRGHRSDKCVFNTKVWEHFIQGLVHFGLAKDLTLAATNPSNAWHSLGTDYQWD